MITMKSYFHVLSLFSAPLSVRGLTGVLFSVGVVAQEKIHTPAVEVVTAGLAIDHTSSDWLLSDGVDGFEFIPRRDLIVTSLGWYDLERVAE